MNQKYPKPRPQDIEYLMAKGNIALARRLEQRQAAAAYAKQLIQRTTPQRVLSA